MEILFIIVKWVFILLTVWGVIRAVMWFWWEDDWNPRSFLVDFAEGLIMPYVTQAEALIKFMPLLLLMLGYAVYHELPPSAQKQVDGWLDYVLPEPEKVNTKS